MSTLVVPAVLQRGLPAAGWPLNGPRVAVLMAVRDGAAHVAAAVQSVLGQTWGDLELLVIDDGSTDGTQDILSAIRDPRLRVERQAPRGLTRSLNRALALTSAPLVARLDADDVALPHRLARQLAFLDAHADTGLLGSAATERDAAGGCRTVRPPEEDGAIRRVLIRRNVFVHSTIMMRRAAVERVGGYDEALAVAQDYDLWLRLARVTRLANLPDALVIRHLLPQRVSVSRENDRLRGEMRARWRAVRTGAYPWWTAVWVARAAVTLAVPRPLRRPLRRLRG